MIWVYYSAQIFLLGAEFTWVYSHEHGSRKGQTRPGAVEDKAPAVEEPKAVAVRIAPKPMPVVPVIKEDLPVHKRKPVATFGIAAAVGAIAGLVFRTKPDFLFHRSRPRLFSRMRWR